MNDKLWRCVAFFAIQAVLSFTLLFILPNTPHQLIDKLSNNLSTSHCNAPVSAAGLNASVQDNCDPYRKPGQLLFDEEFANPRYETFDGICKPAAYPWVKQLRDSIADKTPIPKLQNKEVLILGDSVDYGFVLNLCTYLGVDAVYHTEESYQSISEPAPERDFASCTISHLNLTVANWFFYGYPEDDVFAKNKKHPNIGSFTKRYVHRLHSVDHRLCCTDGNYFPKQSKPLAQAATRILY
jgi:hypothetical protein